MATPETYIDPNYFEVPPSPDKLPAKKREVRVVKRDQQRPALFDSKAADEATLQAAANDRWPKSGNLSTADLLELRTAEKTFPRIDKIIDQSLDLPVKATMPRKKRPRQYTPSRFEKDVALRPRKTKAQARDEFKKLFDPMDAKSPSELIQ